MPATMPSTIDAAKNVSAKRHPNRPALNTSSCGEVSGEATMNATMGAHGTTEAIIPRTAAVVPQEQRGVAAAVVVAITMPLLRLRERKAPAVRWSTSVVIAVAITTLASRKGQFIANVCG